MNTINTDELIKFLISKQSETKTINILDGYKLFQNHNRMYNAPDTVAYYVTNLKQILAYFDWHKIYTTSQITKEILTNYVNYRLSNSKIKNVTLNKELKALYTLENFLARNEYIDSFVKIDLLSETVPQIITVEQKDLDRILVYIKTLSCQSQLIILLLISTGIRTTELTRITKDNVDLLNNQIYLEQTKSKKPRFIFITDNHIKDLIIQNMERNKKNNFLLFSSKDGSQYTANAVREILKKIKRKLDIKKLSPHKLRHTYATHLMEEGADLESVRLLLGHSTYEMTKRYVHLSTRHIKEVNNRYNVLKKSETY